VIIWPRQARASDAAKASYTSRSYLLTQTKIVFVHDGRSGKETLGAKTP
jgi:hypothetical protein